MDEASDTPGPERGQGGPWIGQSVARVEDAASLQGRAAYLDDLRVAGATHMVVVRSPFAHARIRSVDVRPALAMPGVVAAFSGADLLPAWGAPLPVIWRISDDSKVPDHWPLAPEVARYAGDGVAVVVAESPAAAMDAAEAVSVDFEPLAVVADVEQAVAADAPLVHPELGTNRCYTLGLSHGDVDAAFAGAEVVVARSFRQQRILGSPMEPRGVVAEPRPGDEVVLWTSTQVPHIVKRTLAPCVGMTEHLLRVVTPDVGGGFGVKLNVYAEEALAVLLARRLGRPVKWVEQRTEHAHATAHGRGQVQRVEVAADRDGRLRAVRVSTLASMGAYLQLETPGIPIVGRFQFCGAYALQGYAYECTGVFTNQTPTGAYRGAGRPEAIYAIERMMDVLARTVGRDPAEVRRLNFLSEGEMVENGAGIAYDSVAYEGSLDRALAVAGYEELRKEQAGRRGSETWKRLGVGLCSYVDSSGLGPSAVLAKTQYAQGGWEFGAVRVLPGGTIEVLTGTNPQGQGHETAFAQVAADAFGVGVRDVRVLHGDTAVVPMGTGTFSSRSVIVGGTAIIKAAEKVVAKAKRIAAHLLEAAEEDVEFSGGRFAVAGAPERGLTLRDVADAAHVAWNLPPGVEPGLQDSVAFDPVDWTYPFGTHVAVVEVDAETGAVDLVRYVAVDDCGTVINPMIVDGQIHGGIAQGIGQALFEEARYTADGQLETASLLTYLVPSAAELPEFDLLRTVTPSPLNPLGAKGVGEAGAIAAPPAVMNAIHDALGVEEEIDMPASPERVWSAVSAGRRTPDGADLRSSPQGLR